MTPAPSAAPDSGRHAGEDAARNDSGEDPDTSAAAATATSRARVTTTTGDASTFAAASAATTAPASTATPSFTARDAAPTAPVRLPDVPEAVQTTIALAGRNGLTEARIELSPASLGNIQIHLQHTDDGLVARVVTAHPEAAQTLQGSADALRRALQQNGTQLLSLDISTSGRGESEQRGDGADRGTTGPRALDTAAPAAPSTHPSDTTLDAGLTGAALVNVLA